VPGEEVAAHLVLHNEVRPREALVTTLRLLPMFEALNLQSLTQ